MPDFAFHLPEVPAKNKHLLASCHLAVILSLLA